MAELLSCASCLLGFWGAWAPHLSCNFAGLDRAVSWRADGARGGQRAAFTVKSAPTPMGSTSCDTSHQRSLRNWSGSSRLDCRRGPMGRMGQFQVCAMPVPWGAPTSHGTSAVCLIHAGGYQAMVHCSRDRLADAFTCVCRAGHVNCKELLQDTAMHQIYADRPLPQRQHLHLCSWIRGAEAARPGGALHAGTCFVCCAHQSR